jgi:hypothetical protein
LKRWPTYYLIYETPFGKIHAEADTLRQLRSIVSDQVAAMLMPVNELDNMSLDDAAKRVLRLYRNQPGDRRLHNERTRIAQEGVELDVIRYYLQDMTFAEILDRLMRTKNVSIGASSVGRFCRSLRLLGVRPIAKSE